MTYAAQIVDSEELDNTMLSFGISTPMIFAFTQIQNQLLRTNKAFPSMEWAKVSFYDTDYEKDLSVIIPIFEGDENKYTITTLFEEEVEGCSAKIVSLFTMIIFCGYILEKDSDNELAYDLYHGIRGLGFSSDFLTQEEQNLFFRLTAF